MFRQVNWLALTGLVMLAAGVFLVFSPYSMFPLWAIWLVGPLLWYLGAALTVAGIAAHFFGAPNPKKAAESFAEAKSTPHLERMGLATAPARVESEIPAMSGFTL
ncbi:MAG TPA: hypothetical protein VMS96_10770 [Terriglobales bacterium]|nr:hypothetical protein [Terriglobales bacterium]